MTHETEQTQPADEGRLEPPVRPQRVDWHGHGLGWALADAMETGGGHWTVDDVARAFAAGAKVALAMQEPTEMSPEFTDTARAALLWVLWHNQGGSSPIGQPLRFALGMGAHDPLSEHQVQEALRWGRLTKSRTSDFHGA